MAQARQKPGRRTREAKTLVRGSDGSLYLISHRDLAIQSPRDKSEEARSASEERKKKSRLFKIVGEACEPNSGGSDVRCGGSCS